MATAGFAVEKKPGLAASGNGLRRSFRSDAEVTTTPDPYLLDVASEKPAHSVIIGAGIMGACLAHAFDQRGVKVTVLDSGNGLDEGTSANPLALVMPRLDVEDRPAARAMIDSWLRARCFYSALTGNRDSVTAHHVPKDAKEIQRFGKLSADPPLDESVLEAEPEQLRIFRRKLWRLCPCGGNCSQMQR